MIEHRKESRTHLIYYLRVFDRADLRRAELRLGNHPPLLVEEDAGEVERLVEHR